MKVFHPRSLSPLVGVLLVEGESEWDVHAHSIRYVVAEAAASSAGSTIWSGVEIESKQR